MTYYNEHDPAAAQWLRALIAAGHIPPGAVDERDIRDVLPADLAGFDQHHFFAGIGGWAHALRLAGWPDDRPVWTGSCPCQPFSAAGKRRGVADERHLWPAWEWLIRQCRPHVVFGEQVAGKDGQAWLDLVSIDLENLGYTVGALDLCAAGVGAPHIRQRLYWVADAEDDRCQPQPDIPPLRILDQADAEAQCQSGVSPLCPSPSGLADSRCDEQRGRRRSRSESEAGHEPRPESCRCREVSGLGDTNRAGPQGRPLQGVEAGSVAAPGPVNGFWSDAEWIPCRDGTLRPVKSGLCVLAHGVPGRVVRLRGYGNAIVPQLAAEFIRAYLDTEGGHH